jgi:hypothetical protein
LWSPFSRNFRDIPCSGQTERLTEVYFDAGAAEIDRFMADNPPHLVLRECKSLEVFSGIEHISEGSSNEGVSLQCRQNNFVMIPPKLSKE